MVNKLFLKKTNYVDVNNNSFLDPLEFGAQKWENGRLISLDLQGLSLKGEISKNISKLTMLKDIDLRDNLFNGTFVSVFL